MRRRLRQAILLAATSVLIIQIVQAQQANPAEAPDLQNIQTCPAPPSSADELFGPKITIAELRFDGDLRIPVADQEQIASSLKKLTYSGNLNRVSDELLERVREAWQDRGYVKAEVSGENRILSSNPVSENLALTVQVNAGEQYRLGEIAFENNKAITDVKGLRDLFPISDGEISDRSKIAKGLENLRKTFDQYGYANFTAIPTPRFDEENQTVSFDMDIDEGKEFVVGRVRFLGLDQNVSDDLSKELLLKPGDVFNKGLIDLFLKQHASLLPLGISSDSRVRFQLDERRGTVGITFDFRACPVE